MAKNTQQGKGKGTRGYGRSRHLSFYATMEETEEVGKELQGILGPEGTKEDVYWVMFGPLGKLMQTLDLEPYLKEQCTGMLKDVLSGDVSGVKEILDYGDPQCTDPSITGIRKSMEEKFRLGGESPKDWGDVWKGIAARGDRKRLAALADWLDRYVSNYLRGLREWSKEVFSDRPEAIEVDLDPFFDELSAFVRSIRRMIRSLRIIIETIDERNAFLYAQIYGRKPEEGESTVNSIELEKLEKELYLRRREEDWRRKEDNE